MKSNKFSRHFLGLLLVGCLAVVLGACGSAAGAGTTTGTGSSPTATATQATTVLTVTASPTRVVTPHLNVAIACAGTKQNGYGVDVIHGKVCAQTLAKATLSIQVIYCNGKPDPGHVLQGTVTANAHGFYEWNWTPQPDCKGQPIWAWKVTITALLNGQTANATDQGMA